MFQIPDYIKRIIDIISENGFEAYLVGGCVRDFLMGNKPHDYDITTNALPCDIKRIFSDFSLVTTGEKHGTIAVIIEKNCVEITTYRIDGEYSDNRRPEKVSFTSDIYEDLKRRDFTINAIAYNPKAGILDPFDGRKDINDGIIRTVGNPDTRFEEDALRIMRCLRFSSVLGFEIDKSTSLSAINNKMLLKNISAERINNEFAKLISGKYAHNVLRNYRDVIAVVIPEIKNMFEFEQNSPFHKYDVWEHTLHALKAANDPLIKLIMFFHDIAKPSCYTEDETGRGHFKGHAIVSAEMTHNIMKRMKFSSKKINIVTLLIKNHSRDVNNRYEIKKLLSELGEENLARLMEVQRADSLSKETFCKVRLNKIAWISHTAKEIVENQECISLKQLAVNGNDLINIGFKNKEIGRVLNALLDKVMQDKVKNERVFLLKSAKMLR